MAGKSLQTDSAALMPGTWNHALVVGDRSGSLQIYINGSASGAPVDISAMTSLSTASERLAIGAQSNDGAQATGAALAYAALWKRKDWLDSHNQRDLARERFHRMIGIYPQVAQGTPLAEIAQRESDAYSGQDRGGRLTAPVPRGPGLAAAGQPHRRHGPASHGAAVRKASDQFRSAQRKGDPGHPGRFHDHRQ